MLETCRGNGREHETVILVLNSLRKRRRIELRAHDYTEAEKVAFITRILESRFTTICMIYFVPRTLKYLYIQAFSYVDKHLILLQQRTLPVQNIYHLILCGPTSVHIIEKL